jgi:hypothetical protein
MFQAKVNLSSEPEDRRDESLRCVWCEKLLSSSSRPNETTMLFWLHGTCRPCAERFELNVSMEPTCDDCAVARLFVCGRA